jgi:hypothetical protein
LWLISDVAAASQVVGFAEASAAGADAWLELGEEEFV